MRSTGRGQGAGYLASRRRTEPLMMAKSKGGADTSFFCSDCGTEHIKWMGRCSACGAWNTIKEFRTPKGNAMDTLDIRAAGSSQKVRRMLASPTFEGSGGENGADGGGRWPQGGGGRRQRYDAHERGELRHHLTNATHLQHRGQSRTWRWRCKRSVILLAGSPGARARCFCSWLHPLSSRAEVVCISGREQRGDRCPCQEARPGHGRCFLICDIDSTRP